MKSKKRNSIFVKTQIYLIGFCIITLFLLWLFETLFFKLYYSSYQIESVSSIIKNLEKTENIITTYVENLAYKNNVCISIYNDYGEVLTFNGKMNECMIENEKALDKIYKFLVNDKSSLMTKLKFDDGQTGILRGVKNDAYDVFVYAPLSDTRIVSTLMQNQLIYVFLIGMIASVIVCVFVSKLITNPIRALTKKAENIGKEKYDNYFEKTGIGEIDKLNETLNEVQEKLGKVQTYQKDLLANVTHDLKTPLTMIKAYAEKIKDISYKDYDKMVNDLDIIINETDRLTLLVNDILDFSKAEKADKLNIVTYDLVEQINGILSKYEILKETENYEFILDMPDSAFVKADKEKIEQVIYNLVNNAINFTGNDKKVKISVTLEKKNYVVKIIDTGKGIKEKDIKNIWTKYYKNDKNHQRNVISTGLGLAIVKEILEKHQFVYGVDSKVGKGSTFYFKITSSTHHKNNTKKS